MRNLLILFIPVLLLTVGCENDKDDTIRPPDTHLVPASNGILPLKIENRWRIYETIVETGATTEHIWEVTKTLDINDETVFEMSYWKDGVPQTTKNYFRNQEDGLYIYRTITVEGEVNDFNPPKLVLPYPMEDPGYFDSWLAPHHARFRGANKSIGVPAGSFTCHKYELYFDEESDRMQSSFWAPQVGFVMQFEYIEGELFRKWELINFFAYN